MSGRGERLLAMGIRLLPHHRQELGRALLVETAAVAPRRRKAWLAGGLWFVAKETAMWALGYGCGLGAGVAVLVTVDRIGNSDDSSQVSMVVLLVGALVLGFAAPRWAWLSGVVLGSTLAVSAMISVALNPQSVQVPKPGGLGGAATLFVLVVPALAGTYIGVGSASLWRRR
jgi:hypothetical protein